MKITQLLIPTLGLLGFASGLQAAPTGSMILNNSYLAIPKMESLAGPSMMNSTSGCDPCMQQDRHTHHGDSN